MGWVSYKEYYKLLLFQLNYMQLKIFQNIFQIELKNKFAFIQLKLIEA